MIHVGKAQTRWWNNLNCTQDLVSWNPTSVNRHVKSPVILSDLPRAVVDPEKKGFPTKACTGPLFRVYNLHYILKSTTAFTHSLESSLLTGMKHLSNPALFKGLVKLISMESLLAGWRKFVWIFPGKFNFGELWQANLVPYLLIANCLDCPELWAKEPKTEKAVGLSINGARQKHSLYLSLLCWSMKCSTKEEKLWGRYK